MNVKPRFMSRKDVIGACILAAITVALILVGQLDYVRTRNHEMASCMTKGE